MKIDMTLTFTAITAIVSLFLSIYMPLRLLHIDKKKRLDEQLDAIIKISIQYPYLESKKFTSEWVSDFDKENEQYLRYDVYCNLLFNFLSRVASYYRYDNKKMEDYITIKDWIRYHKKCWQDPTSPHENSDSYDKKFVDLINNYIQ